MPKFADKLVVPVEIPMWGVLSGIGFALFSFGILYSELKTVVKNQDKVEVMYERQIKNIEAVNRHEQVLREHQVKIENHASRLQSLERLADRSAR